MTPRAWTEADDALLRERYVRDGLKATAEALQRSEGAVAVRAHRIGVKVRGTDQFRDRVRRAAGGRDRPEALSAG